MPIALARVDDRLVHGQVSVGWARAVQADRLLVACDESCADPLQRSLMQLAVPPGLSLSILTVEEAARRDRAGELDGARAIVLFRTPRDALAFLDAGGRLPALNVGGMRFREGKRKVNEAVALDDDDVAVLRTLAARGVEIECRVVPTDRHTDLLSRLDESRA